MEEVQILDGMNCRVGKLRFSSLSTSEKTLVRLYRCIRVLGMDRSMVHQTHRLNRFHFAIGSLATPIVGLSVLGHRLRRGSSLEWTK